MKQTSVRRNLFISVVALLTVLFALPASAKTALDKYAGKTIKTTTRDTIRIVCDKGAKVDKDAAKISGKAIQSVDFFTVPGASKPTLFIYPEKIGTGTVTLKYKYKGKTTSYKLKIKVTKYVCPGKSIAFGKYKYLSKESTLFATKGYTLTYMLLDGVTKKYSGKFTVTPKSGWKVKKIIKETAAGKKSKVKNKSKVKVNGQTIFHITMENKKTKETSEVLYTYYGSLGA